MMGCCNHSQKHVNSILMAQRPSYVPESRAVQRHEALMWVYAITASHKSSYTLRVVSLTGAATDGSATQPCPRTQGN